MTLTRLIGDIHGNWYEYQQAIHGAEHSIQVGDFGIGFGSGMSYWDQRVEDWQTDNPNHRFIRGNHDNPAVCKSMPNILHDGTVENDVMFIGGAWSIDKDYRTPNFDWWEDEECSDKQFEHFLDVYSIARPRVMITHDCPQSISTKMFLDTGLARWGGKSIAYPTRTGQMFDRMFAIHQPDEWYFGHWHHTKTFKEGNTTFQCLGEFDYMDVEL